MENARCMKTPAMLRAGDGPTSTSSPLIVSVSGSACKYRRSRAKIDPFCLRSRGRIERHVLLLRRNDTAAVAVRFSRNRKCINTINAKALRQTRCFCAGGSTSDENSAASERQALPLEEQAEDSVSIELEGDKKEEGVIMRAEEMGVVSPANRGLIHFMGAWYVQDVCQTIFS